MLNYKYILIFFALLVLSCEPVRDDDIQLPATSGTPEFSLSFVAGDSNRVILTDLTAGGFQRLWDLPGGAPKSSVRTLDTVTYAKAGEYTITLFVSKADGSGTVSASRKVTIASDATLACGPKMALLTGDCGPGGKCWAFSRAAGAVKVGPTYDDFQWYTSPADGLQAEQYDDRFCFTFEGQVYKNNNNGASVNPWNGYAPEEYDPGTGEFTFLEGTGVGGRDQIILPDNQFIGVWDADNILDVVKLTATELVVRARQRMQNGTPNAEGWFELHFVSQ